MVTNELMSLWEVFSSKFWGGDGTSISPSTSTCAFLQLWGIVLAWIIKIYRIGSGHGPVRPTSKDLSLRTPPISVNCFFHTFHCPALRQAVRKLDNGKKRLQSLDSLFLQLLPGTCSLVYIVSYVGLFPSSWAPLRAGPLICHSINARAPQTGKTSSRHSFSHLIFTTMLGWTRQILLSLFYRWGLESTFSPQFQSWWLVWSPAQVS